MFTVGAHPPTAAKRACRRKEAHVEGVAGSTTTAVKAGQRITLLQRCQAGAAWSGSEGLPSLEVLYQVCACAI